MTTRCFPWRWVLTPLWIERRVTNVGHDMSGGAFWRWYIGHVDIERVMVSAADMLTPRAERYRMLGWTQQTDDDALIEVYTLDPAAPGDSHTALVTECATADQARERFCSYVEAATAWFSTYRIPARELDDVEI